MEQFSNGFTLKICPGAFPLSTDSMALANFVRLPKNARVLDLGSGCGTLGVLLCGKDAACQVTGIELDPDAHATAPENIQDNALEQRLMSICGDLRQIPKHLYGRFHVCLSNPPYFSGGPSGKHTTARREDHCDPEALFSAASKALQWGGDFYLVHRPERLAELCACAVQHNLQPKVLCLLRHTEGGDVSLILLQCRKGAKPGLQWQEQALHRADGSFTPYYTSLYH